jgi:hypothetical protein
MCKIYLHGSDQYQDSSANWNFQRALLLPVSLAMLSLYALRSTWELRRAAKLARFLVWLLSVCMCVCVSVCECVCLSLCVCFWLRYETLRRGKQKINKNGKCSSRVMNPTEHRLRLQWSHHTESFGFILGSTLQRGCISCHFLTGSKPVFYFRINLTLVASFW